MNPNFQTHEQAVAPITGGMLMQSPKTDLLAVVRYDFLTASLFVTKGQISAESSRVAWPL